MADVQPENGTTPIANEILERLCKINLSAYESRFIWLLFRKTYGFHKKTDWISLSQFSKHLDLDRRLVHRTIKKLKERNMLVIETDGGKRIKYGFQKDFDLWKDPEVSSVEMTKKQGVIRRDDKGKSRSSKHSKKVNKTKVSCVIYTDDKVSSIQIPTNNTITNIKTPIVETQEFRLAKYLFNHISKRRPNFKKPNFKAWTSDIEKMIRIDKRDTEEIKKVIEWCQKDDFWKNNILSTTKLRKQYDQLALKMESEVEEMPISRIYQDLN